MSIALVCMVGVNVIEIQKLTTNVSDSGVYHNKEKIINLSKNGKNVVVIMLDRALGLYIPFIFNEKPFLEKQYDGFTYYPNTISFGAFTNFGTPGLFGGYEYIPEEMNKRVGEPLKDKHNEALMVLPLLLEDEGFDITLCDLPYANYKWIPDMSMFDGHSRIKTHITSGMFGSDINKGRSEEANETVSSTKRNFCLFPFVKSLPLILQKYIYDNGNYNVIKIKKTNQVIVSPVVANGLNKLFMEKYNVLNKLSDMTEIQETGDTALFFVNDTTHEPALLQLPDYVPAYNVDNSKYEKENENRFSINGENILMASTNQRIHYQANMAAILQLGKWFDYLRANGVYDNTRIIIVSDHGRGVRHSDKYILKDNTDLEYFNALLLFKDFNHSTYGVSNKLMTNADVPVLVTNGLINNPKNPFTGKPLNNDYKKKDKLFIFGSHTWNVNKNNGNTFEPGPWYSVEKDVRDKKNWKLVKENAVLPY